MALYKTCTFAFFAYQKSSWTSFSVPKGGPGIYIYINTYNLDIAFPPSEVCKHEFNIHRNLALHGLGNASFHGIVMQAIFLKFYLYLTCLYISVVAMGLDMFRG